MYDKLLISFIPKLDSCEHWVNIETLIHSLVIDDFAKTMLLNDLDNFCFFELSLDSYKENIKNKITNKTIPLTRKK